ncbi:MAG: right-handed parallel beta-helix repeat-containing protein [Phycisphaerae bacterium]|nr:right-handed parallel beta-helix repeat-containing protein [Phycisphaerae bacterium]
MMFLPRLTHPLLVALAVMGAALSVQTAAATQHLVAAGDDWSKLKEKLKPGDEIILMPGNHKGARFDDLAGEPGKPIVIRSPDPKTVSRIDADDVGIYLVRPRWVRIQNIFIVDARRAGIIIAGDAKQRSSNISIVNVYVAKSGDLAEKAGIRIEFADHVAFADCRVEAWHRAGIHVHASTDVALVGVQLLGGPLTDDVYGVAIDGGSSSVILERCRFGREIGTAVAIGLSDTDTPPAPPTPAATPGSASGPVDPSAPVYLAEAVTVERSIVDHVKTFIAFGSCANVLVRANTVVEPQTAYALFEPPAGYAQITGSSFLANLMQWTPGSLKRFSFAGGGVDPKGLSVETNLWSSAELPLAKSLLGDFVGTVKSEQVLNVDPKLDGYQRPMNDAAKIFGHTSP